jgi:hypothetical protein
VKVRGLKKVLNSIRKAVTETDDALFREIAEYVRNRMVMKARTGKRMNFKGDQSFPKPLDPKYVRRREIAQSTGKPPVDSEFFSPSRSNITFTGQYLKSIGLGKVDKRNRIIEIEPKGVRKGENRRAEILNSRKPKRKKPYVPLTNAKLAEYLAEMGRNIFGLDPVGRKSVKQRILRDLRKKLRKNILRK